MTERHTAGLAGLRAPATALLIVGLSLLGCSDDDPDPGNSDTNTEADVEIPADAEVVVLSENIDIPVTDHLGMAPSVRSDEDGLATSITVYPLDGEQGEFETLRGRVGDQSAAFGFEILIVDIEEGEGVPDDGEGAPGGLVTVAIWPSP